MSLSPDVTDRLQSCHAARFHRPAVEAGVEFSELVEGQYALHSQGSSLSFLLLGGELVVKLDQSIQSAAQQADRAEALA
jgi:hypothetical protein